MSSGAALGATVWPIIFGNLPQRIGFPWTMRLIGFMTGFLGVLAFFCLKTRLPPKPPGPFFYLSAFKMPAYSFVTLGSVVGNALHSVSKLRQWTVLCDFLLRLADLYRNLWQTPATRGRSLAAVGCPRLRELTR